MATRHGALSRQQLMALLGMQLRKPAKVERISRRNAGGYAVAAVRIDGNGATFPATLLEPDTPNGAAILYCHAHGDRYDIGRAELIGGRPAIDPPFGPDLARAGFAVLCADMPGFGERQGEGSEAVLTKAALWNGETMMGRMLGDLRAGLDVLASRDGIDTARIGAFGLSMGATHAYWLAALDDRIAAVAHACALSNIGPMIAAGVHDQHGIYMTVPGLLSHGDMGDVAALAAPRPQLVASGGKDPLTPRLALEPALAALRNAYEENGDLTILTEPEAGHELTLAMRQAVLDFFRRTLAA